MEFGLAVRLAVLVIAFAWPLAAGTAHACDRPGTPSNVTAIQTSEVPPIVQVSWINTATETVFWDVEMTDGQGNPVGNLPPGVGRGDTGKGLRVTNSFTVDPGVTRCFRVRARTERGPKGCVSQLFSNRACVTTIAAAAPLSTGFSAIAADRRGSWGFAVGMRTEAEARSGALRGCGLPACSIQRVARAPCIAYVESRSGGYWFGFSIDQTQAKVRSVAQAGCAKGAPAGTCRLVDARCR